MAKTAAAYIAAADMAASTKYPELEQISDPTMMAQQNGVDKDEKCLFPRHFDLISSRNHFKDKTHFTRIFFNF